MTKKDKILFGLIGLSVVITIFGLLFLVSAAELLPVFEFLTEIPNVLLRYIIVIVTMSCGIMLFSNAAARLSNKKLRNGLSIGITVFATILTVPLVYVFIAIFFAHNGMVGPVGEVMMLNQIVDGFVEWFDDGAFVYVVYVFMLILSIVFIAVPIITCVQTCKGKPDKPKKKFTFGKGKKVAEKAEIEGEDK